MSIRTAAVLSSDPQASSNPLDFTSHWPFEVLLRGVREVLYEEDGGAGPGPVPPRPRVCHPTLPQ